MTCEICGTELVRMVVENEEGDWTLYWSCDCTMADARDDGRPKVFVHNGRACALRDKLGIPHEQAVPEELR